MSNRMPSLLALLGLVAVAGYQNRDKIGELIKDLAGSDPAGGAGGLLESVKKSIGDNPTTAAISGGIGELVDRFRTSGQGDTADSWVNTGPNASVDDSQVESALGAELIDRLVGQTGLSREELLKRLSQVLPEAVDRLTPEGRLPS